MKVIYIASPYTIGDKMANVNVQIDAANVLMDNGICPILPLLSYFQHRKHPRPYEDWLEIDFEKVRRCDGVLRLPGKSDGANREVRLAYEIGKPVYFRIEEAIGG